MKLRGRLKHKISPSSWSKRGGRTLGMLANNVSSRACPCGCSDCATFACDKLSGCCAAAGLLVPNSMSRDTLWPDVEGRAELCEAAGDAA